jgi:hypothetical protein
MAGSISSKLCVWAGESLSPHGGALLKDSGGCSRRAFVSPRKPGITAAVVHFICGRTVLRISCMCAFRGPQLGPCELCLVIANESLELSETAFSSVKRDWVLQSDTSLHVCVTYLVLCLANSGIYAIMYMKGR